MIQTKKTSLFGSRADHTHRIYFAWFNDNVRVDLETARNIVATRLETMQEGTHFLIIDISNVREVTPEAREFLLRPDSGLKNIVGAAFVVNNPVAALLGNVFAKTAKTFPSRVFVHRDDAFSWIKSMSKPIDKC